MICPHCGAAAVMGQRFCQECGATLLPAPVITGIQVVGDGSDAAMKRVVQGAALQWMRDHKGQIIVLGVAAVAAIIIVTLLFIAALAATAAAVPIIAIIVALRLAGPRRRRHRRWMGRY